LAPDHNYGKDDFRSTFAKVMIKSHVTCFIET